MLLTGLITPTLFYYSCLNCKAQLPIIQFRFFKIKNSILMIQFFFILFSLSMISPCLATEMSSSEDMSLIPAGKSQMGSKKSLLELRPHDLFNTDRHTLGPENQAH